MRGRLWQAIDEFSHGNHESWKIRVVHQTAEDSGLQIFLGQFPLEVLQRIIVAESEFFNIVGEIMRTIGIVPGNAIVGILGWQHYGCV